MHLIKYIFVHMLFYSMCVSYNIKLSINIYVCEWTDYEKLEYK